MGTKLQIGLFGLLLAGAASAAPSATTLSLSPTSSNPSVFGQTVQFVATVSPGGATGTVAFFAGATLLGTAPVSLGLATINVSGLSVGTHSITAHYSGDAGFDPSSSTPMAHTVLQAATSINLGLTPNPSVFGQAVSLIATVTVQAPGTGIPSGNVLFFEGETQLGTVPLDASGQAVLTTSALSAGTHSFGAEYLGSTNFGEQATVGLMHVVNPANTATLVSSGTNPSVFGQSVTFTATVTPQAPGGGTPTGTVSFVIGGVPQPPIALSSGVATFTTSGLSLGITGVTAIYNGSSNHAASTGNTVSQTVNQANTATAVATSPNPSISGAAVTITATVTAVPPGAGTPTGSVTFFEGVTPIGTALLDGSGQASITTSSLAIGPHPITAIYVGSANFTASTSAVSTHTVNKASTTTTVGSAPNPSDSGAPVTFTATVSVTPPGSGIPTGLVDFFDGAILLGSAPLVGGQASFTTSALSPGSHSITALYSGDANVNGSTSPAHTHTVNKAATTTTVVSSVNPSVFGQPVTFTATVTSSAGTPTGSVNFFDGAVALGSGTLDGSGLATFSASALASGTHSITAVYAGDASFLGSTSSALTQTVNKAATTTTAVSSVNPAAFGQSFTATVTVAASAPAAGTPTGTVIAVEGATTLGSATLASGQGTITLSGLSAGPHTITFSYSGDANFNGSIGELVQAVNQAATTTVLTSSPNPAGFGATVTFTATVNVTAPGAGTPTGTVTFRDGATTLGTSALDASRQATFSTSALPAGARSITATYNADTNFSGSTSAPLAQTISTATTRTTVAVPATPGTAGQPATITATVTSAAGTPTGRVTFRDGTREIGSALLDASGTASINASLPIGSHAISAVYAGDGTFSGSTSNTVTFAVNSATTSVSTPVLRSGTPVVGELLTFAATVTSNGQMVPGLVTFRDGATTLGTAPLDTQGTAVLSARLSSAGVHLITAHYEGDELNAPSTSDYLVLQVRGPATVEVTSSANPSAAGAPVTFTATVSGADGDAPVPLGNVTFRDGATWLGTVALTNGQASFTTSTLAMGEHTIVAEYAGGTYYLASTAAALIQLVERGATTTVLLPGADAAGYFLTARVTAQAEGAGTPGGTVQFEDAAGGAVLGTATLANGSAMLRLSEPLPAGRSLRAVYSGNEEFAGSTSAALPFAVAANAFSFTFPSFAGDAIVSLFGAGFTDETVAAPDVPLPTTLGGVTVNAVDAAGETYPASLYFVSPGQINLVLPPEIPAGPARLVVANVSGTFTVPVLVVRVSPSLASGNGSGSGPAAAHLLRVHADGSQDPLITVTQDPVPFGEATDGLYLILYGTGFRNAQGTTSCSFNGQPESALFAGAQAMYPGLDQINVQVPGTLRGAGQVTVSCTVDGQTTNTVSINVQ